MQTVNYRDKIRFISESRDIQYLLHFTQISNLDGIAKNGILSRQELEKLEYIFYPSAPYRLDEDDDSVSVSISRVNVDMFFSKRTKSGHLNWIVLVISPEILWTHNCRFCWCNAAKNEIKNRRGWRGGPWAFDKMFSGNEDERISIPPSCPTDPEAEVQVLEPIAPTCIIGAIVENSQMLELLQNYLYELFDRPIPVVVDCIA